MVIDASGLTALDLQDALNNLAAGGAEAIEVNDRRVVTGVPIAETSDGVAVDGVVVVPPWKISVIGDADRLSDIADLMSQQLRADRRVGGGPPPRAAAPPCRLAVPGETFRFSVL